MFSSVLLLFAIPIAHSENRCCLLQRLLNSSTKQGLGNHIYLILSVDFIYEPELEQGYPLNLSILISGGKETNKDFLSNGEWTGKSSSWKSTIYCWIVVSRNVTMSITGWVSWNRAPKRVKAPFLPADTRTRYIFFESRSLRLER